MSSRNMGFSSVIYGAAREGKVARLRLFLDHRTKEQVAELIHTKTDGATPLIASCRNGHLPVVEYLIETCTADIEQPGSVRFDGETIEGAPPLWCAAAAGHIRIVKYLIGCGAAVNNTTMTNSTPLRAACFDGHFDIVQFLSAQGADIEIANRHGHTCLMISCYKGHYRIVKFLIEEGADVNRKSLKGNTALHDCAESGSLDILKLLLNHKATMVKDSYGMTPLMAAAVTGHVPIVEYLVSLIDCDKPTAIDALELLGATFVDKKRDMIGAIKNWRRAMALRYSMPSRVIRKVVSTTTVSAYQDAVEVTTMDELDNLITDPDQMRMQALLVRERILGPAHPDTTYYIRYRGAVYADMGNFERCVTLWQHALDMQQKILEPLNPMTQSSLLSFAELFSFMMADARRSQKHTIEFKDIMAVFHKSVRELKLSQQLVVKQPLTEKDSTSYNRLVLIVVHLLCLLCKIQATLTETEMKEMEEIVYSLIKLNPRSSQGRTMLHLACSSDTTTVGRYPVCKFPSAEVAKLLLELDASVDSVDFQGDMPLHVAGKNSPCDAEVIETLLNGGAHVDARNSKKECLHGLILNTDVSINPLPYQTLQCLSAKVVMDNNVPYKGLVPRRIEPFIELH